MNLNGFPDRPPIPAVPYPGDYYTAMFTAYAAMAALYRRTITGKGEVIDSAQFEVLISVQGPQLGTYLNTGVLPVREGNHSPATAGYGAYVCKDGKAIYTLMAGVGVVRNAMKLFGLEFDDEIPVGSAAVPLNTPGGDKFEAAIQKFCDEHTALEVEDAFACRRRALQPYLRLQRRR